MTLRALGLMEIRSVDDHRKIIGYLPVPNGKLVAGDHVTYHLKEKLLDHPPPKPTRDFHSIILYVGEFVYRGHHFALILPKNITIETLRKIPGFEEAAMP